MHMRRRRGQAIVEFALVVTAFLFLLLAGTQLIWWTVAQAELRMALDTSLEQAGAGAEAEYQSHFSNPLCTPNPTTYSDSQLGSMLGGTVSNAQNDATQLMRSLPGGSSSTGGVSAQIAETEQGDVILEISGFYQLPTFFSIPGILPDPLPVLAVAQRHLDLAGMRKGTSC